jgi:hypothetical protein
MAEKTVVENLVVDAVLTMTFTDGQTATYRAWVVKPGTDDTVWVADVDGTHENRLLGATVAIELQTAIRQFNEKW